MSALDLKLCSKKWLRSTLQWYLRQVERNTSFALRSLYFNGRGPSWSAIYQWCGYFFLPPACTTGFGCNRGVQGGAQRQLCRVARDGGCAGVAEGMPLWKLVPQAACLIASVLLSFLSHEVEHFQLQGSWQFQCGGFQSLWHTILNMLLLRRSIQPLDLWLQTETQKNHLKVPSSFPLWLGRLDWQRVFSPKSFWCFWIQSAPGSKSA